MKDLIPILEQIARMGKPLLIIAEDVEEGPGNARGEQAAGTLQVCAVKAPALETEERPCSKTSPS